MSFMFFDVPFFNHVIFIVCSCILCHVVTCSFILLDMPNSAIELFCCLWMVLLSAHLLCVVLPSSLRVLISFLYNFSF